MMLMQSVRKNQSQLGQLCLTRKKVRPTHDADAVSKEKPKSAWAALFNKKKGKAYT